MKVWVVLVLDGDQKSATRVEVDNNGAIVDDLREGVVKKCKLSLPAHDLTVFQDKNAFENAHEPLDEDAEVSLNAKNTAYFVVALSPASLEGKSSGVDVSAIVRKVKTTTSMKPTGLFVNRDRELGAIARLLLENQSKLQHKEEGQQNNLRIVLPVTCQMFGAGKTYFGQHVMSELQAREDIKSRLADEFTSELVSDLLNMQHAFVELQFTSSLVGVHEAIIEALLRLHTGAEEDAKFLASLSQMPSPTVAKIVALFEHEFSSSYFLQFDDPSNIVSSPNVLRTLLAEIASLMNQCRTDGKFTSSVFITGRSPIFWLMGNQKISIDKTVLSSPSSAECIVLDNLKLVHVEKLIEHSLGTDSAKQLANNIMKLTMGVPRFVYGVVHGLEQKRITPQQLNSADPTLLNYMKTAYSNELLAWDALLTEKPTLAVELIRMASLGCPFRLGSNVPDSFQGLLLSNLGDFSVEGGAVPIMFCSTYSLYLERMPVTETIKDTKDEYFRFIIPPICISAIDWDKHPRFNRLPFLFPSETMDVSTAAEVAVRNCIRLRVSDELVETKGSNLGLVLPVLADCLLSNLPVALSGGNSGYGSMPKLVLDGCNEKKTSVIATLMQTATSDACVTSQIPRSQLSLVWQHMRSDVLYLPAPRSKSADILLRLGNSLLEIQVKSGKQQVTESMMEKELRKSFYSLIGVKDGINHISFVMLCLGGVHPDFVLNGNPVTSTDKSTDVKDVLAYTFAETTVFKGFTVPANMDVTILTYAGVCSILTDHSVNVLLNFKLDVTSMHAATSPSKKKRV